VSWLRGTLTCLCLALPAAGQGQGGPQRVDEVLQRLAAERDVQTTLPGKVGGEADPAGGDRPPPANRRGIRTGRAGVPREGSGRSPGIRFGDGAGGIAKVLAWALVVVVAVLLLAAIVRAVMDRQRAAARVKGKATAPATPAVAAAPPPLLDYERLALEGRFTEAVHALLLHAFVALATRRGTGWPAARTGREILAAVGGFHAGDAPLHVVFQTAELGWFGRVAVDRDQYERCLRSYRDWSAR
jgi:hypothetical protein